MAAGAWRMERGGSLIFLLHQGSPQALVVTSAMVGVDRHCLLILCHPVSWFRALVIRISESWKLCIWIRVIQSNISLKNLHKSETDYLNLESVCVCVCVLGGGSTYVHSSYQCQTRWVRTDTLWQHCPAARSHRCIWNYKWPRSCLCHCRTSCNRCLEETVHCSGALHRERGGHLDKQMWGNMTGRKLATREEDWCSMHVHIYKV